jgi:alkyl hydroperoxide reductase subunit D
MEAAAGVAMAPAAVEAAKSAGSVMVMNNVYYRFVHLASNSEYKTTPARLRMNWLGNPSVDRTDFVGAGSKRKSMGAVPA